MPASLHKAIGSFTVASTLLLTGLPSAKAANGYQAAIDKVLPGYTILTNEEMGGNEKWVEDFLSPNELKARKERPALGLIEGRFNRDAFPDFAALVVKHPSQSASQTVPATSDHPLELPGALVVCLGTGAPGKYKCEVLPPSIIRLPNVKEFVVFHPPKPIQCGEANFPIDAYYPNDPRDYYPDEPGAKSIMYQIKSASARELSVDYDAIGEYSIGVNAGRTLIRRKDGVYLDCADVD